ncbi:hypothetical protein GCM10009530_63500 [Microbispora corallina]|uniref:Uncharacterized protein n=1 Tax=Microbispora corallina TaxID=83302 RepID=A0ABQ4GBF0_9ACTN|nr:hypothetical protein Mco01_74200 [Microbispora corallina]
MEVWLANSNYLKALMEADPEDRGDVFADQLAVLLNNPTKFESTDLPLKRQIDVLDEWLIANEDRVSPKNLRERITKAFPGDVLQRELFAAEHPFTQAARAWAELLVAAGQFEADAQVQQAVYRATRILGLVELLLKAPQSIAGADDVLWALRDRLVLYPDKIFIPLRSALARKPGWADLYVVREEWNRYVPGEIAHIENVMAHEFRERVLTRTDESELTVTNETDVSRTQELDAQSTSRFDLSAESRGETKLAAHVEGQVDTSGQYGPTHLDTHIGGSLDYSAEQSQRQAVQQAREIVARAVNRVEERTREQRVSRTLTRIEDRNTHRIDNAEGGAAAGVYRWVDKIVRLRTYKYPHRFLLEFEVPEPGAYLRWLEHRHSEQGFHTTAPVPFTSNGKSESESNPALLPTDISESPTSPTYYLRLAARWHALGITPPPSKSVTVSGWLNVPAGDPGQDKTAVDLWITPMEGSAPGTGTAGAPEGAPVHVPEGYQAADRWDGWVSTWDQADAITPAWNTGPDKKNSYDFMPPAAFITVGDSQNDPAEPHNVVIPKGARGAFSVKIGGKLDGRRTGILPITVLSANFGLMSVQVRVQCDRLPDRLLTWQLETYAKLQAAYFELLHAHEDERAARQVQAAIDIKGRSPGENERMMREELKRQVLELLAGKRFAGTDFLDFDANERPHTKIAESRQGAALIQFLEQAFEWENLTFVMYPYFWASADRWDDLQGITSPDPNYARFLRAGSARVVLAARPGFACTVLYYLATGKPWHGRSAPIPGHKEYVSVAQEIAAQTGAPDDGTPVGDTWEVRLPTTLVWLDSDSSLPKRNTDSTFPAPPPAK